MPTANSRLCSTHFHEASFDRSRARTQLKRGAVPTMFSLPKHLQRKTKSRQTATAAKAATPAASTARPKHQKDLSLAQAQGLANDHTYAALSESHLKAEIHQLREKLKLARKGARNAKLRESRAKLTSKKAVDNLKRNNLLSEELEAKLESYKDIPCELFARPTKSYTNDQRKFALTMHLYSPKAYNHLKEKVGISLPEERTLRRWLEKIDASAGLNTGMLEAIRKKQAENPDVYTRCCFMLDAMAIKQAIQYDQAHSRMVGFVDLGENEESQDEAKEVLVFMIVGLNGRWKAPIAYYLTKTLNAEVQHGLVLHAIEKLFEIGLQVCAITLDGHATNLAMCRLLGCQMDPSHAMQSSVYVSCSQTPIFVFLDACHMIKLVRNLLQAYGIIKSPEGLIKWNYLNMLHEHQEETGLRIANKLSSRHVDFHKQKMKVNLAVQTISNSVAAALQLFNQLGEARFAGSEATVKFIQENVHHRLASGH